jgi:hypothetical protein
MTLKKLAVSVGISAALGLGAAGQAHATAEANALIDISNFILSGPTGAPLALTDFSQLSFLDTLNNFAVLNGTPANTFAQNNTFTASTNAPLACVGLAGACAGIGEDNYTPGVVPPPLSYARSDSLLMNQPISGTGFPTGVRAATIAETLLNNVAGTGGSSTNIVLTSGFTFVATHDMGSVDIDFDARAFLRAWTASGSLPGTSAGAGFKWEVQLQDQAGNVLLDWVPDGTIGSGTEIGVNVLAEDCRLVNNATATFNQPASPTEDCSGHFHALTTFALVAGQHYSFTINQTSTSQATEVERTVAEPGALALFGIALTGLGFVRRRRS